MLEQRKGITPVIAIVLLLLVTVGAVGVVYTQFQNIANSGDTEFQTQARNTHVQIDSLSSSAGGDNVTMVFTNRQDSVTIANKTEMLQIQYKPNADSEYGPYSALPQGNLETSPNGESDQSCFNGTETMAPGATHECDLGIQWPDATESFGIQISVKGASNSDNLGCTISTRNDQNYS
jgi:flagellin-like protein